MLLKLYFIIQFLKEKLASLVGDKKDNISLDINFTGSGGSMNVKDVKSVGQLLEMSAFIHSKNDAYNKEIDRYGLSEKNIAPFTMSEKNVSQWKEIIDKAIKELINKKEIDQVKEAIAEFEDCLDAEAKAKMKFEKIAAKALAPIV